MPGIIDPPKGFVQAVVLTGLFKIQVSEMAKERNGVVVGFRSRPLEQAPYTSLWLDALSQRCRESERVVNVAPAIATAIIAQVNWEVRRPGYGYQLRRLLREGLSCAAWHHEALRGWR